MIIKYRVHEVAKDLGVPSKEIIDFLAKYYEEPRKHMTALSEEELNLIFDHYTKERAVDSFDEYFAANTPPQTASKPAAKAAKEKQKENAQPSAEKGAEAKKGAAKAKEEKGAAKAKETEKAAAGKKAEQKAEAEKGAAPAAQKPAQAAQAPSRQRAQKQQANKAAHSEKAKAEHGARGDNAAASAQGPKEAKGGQKQQAQRAKQQNQQQKTVVQQKTKTGAVRYVDTRGAEIELDKYNEHYEEIAPESVKRETAVGGKQKIKQKSASRKPYSVKRDSEAEKLRRLEHEKQKQKQLKVSIPDEISVGELASRLKVSAATLIKKLISLGVMASVSDVIDFDTASLAAMELGAKVEKEVVLTIEDQLIDDSEDKEEDLQPRDPVVCVMGHVDHGKTSLLDAIRHTNVAAGEAGGITQSIGAYRVHVQGRDITFIDTPGHEAFTAMRARGAMITDIAILVVAADDGIMPQTVEAINHAKAAKVSIIVAINKIDKPGANPERVKQQLTEYGLVPEEWGGDTICVPVSAVKHQNLDKLLENVLLVADINELKANPNRAAKGAVIEARLDKGKGPVATVLVQNGTLHKGDIIIAGTAVGHVRVMTDDRGNPIESAGPSVPVEITGLSEVPEAGDIFHVVKDERMARELVEQRREKQKEEQFKRYQKVTLDNLFSQMEQGEIKELNLIVKADVQGSVEAVTQALEKLSNDEVRVKVIHGGVGAINDNDVMLAQASNAIIIGFNVRPEADARKSAELSGVEIRTYRVIYECIDEVKAAMKGMLAPKTREVQLGRVEVRQTYKISSVGTIAGCYVLEGKVTRNSLVRVVRDGIVVAEDKVASLKRFKDDVKEVVQGYECGIGLEKFNDIKVGDIFETYVIEEYRD